MKAVRNIIVILLLTFLVAAHAADWKLEVVGAGGTFSSLRIDGYGNAHVAYFDNLQNVLKYSFWDHRLEKWFTTTLDKSGGFCSLVLDSRMHPHVSYLDYGTGKIRHAWWDGSSWKKETIQLPAQEISFYTSIALDSSDNPGVSFYEYFGITGDNVLRLRHVSWNGSYWEARTVDSTPGSGKFNSTASDSQGYPHIAYANVKYENATLRYARWNGQSWKAEIVEGIPGTGYAAFSVFLAIDKADIPHIAYTDITNRQVKYATRQGSRWNCEVVDSIVKAGYPDRNGLVIDDNGETYISFYDAGTGVLKVAHKTGRVWVTEEVDRNFAGYASSLQIHDGMIWVSYADESAHVLKVARRPLAPPAGSTPTGVEPAADHARQPQAAQ